MYFSDILIWTFFDIDKTYLWLFNIILNFSWARIWQYLYVCLSGAWRLKKLWDLAEIFGWIPGGVFFIFQKFWYLGLGDKFSAKTRLKLWGSLETSKQWDLAEILHTWPHISPSCSNIYDQQIIFNKNREKTFRIKQKHLHCIFGPCVCLYSTQTPRADTVKRCHRSCSIHLRGWKILTSILCLSP